MKNQSSLSARKMDHAKEIYMLCKRINESHLTGVVDLTDCNSEGKLQAAHQALLSLSLERKEPAGECNV